MKKLFKYSALTGAALVLLSVVLLILLRLYAQHKVAREIRIIDSRGIHSIEKIKLGGLDQWIQIRGEDRSKPILLFLHGGPGFPQMPFSHLNAELEKDFVVVQWDQRGAGKSYSWSIPNESMQVDQFVSDAHDLVQLLLQRFHAPKCYLVAHSWRSIFGTLTVARYPELFLPMWALVRPLTFPKPNRFFISSPWIPRDKTTTRRRSETWSESARRAPQVHDEMG